MLKNLNSFLFLFIFSISSFASSSSFAYQDYDFKKLSQQLGYHEDYYFNATDDEISALLTYTDKSDTFYKDINTYLRSYPSEKYDWYSIAAPEAKKIVKNLESYIQKVPDLPKDIILYRGSTLKYRGNKSLNKGEEILEKGFLSTSVNLDVANHFAQSDVNKNSESEFQSKNNKERQALYLLYTEHPIKGILVDENEDEVLLNHGLKLKIMDLIIDGNHDFYLTQICKKVCSQEAPSELIKLFKLRFREE